jgi:hypothetical protein
VRVDAPEHDAVLDHEVAAEHGGVHLEPVRVGVEPEQAGHAVAA